MAKSAPEPRTALVLSGGGARGAYEAGVMHYLRTALPKPIAESPLFRVYSGTSVGAINTAFLASTAHDPVFQGVRLRSLWRDLTDADIYRTDAHALVGFLLRTGFFTATNFLGLYRVIERQFGSVSTFPFKGVLDTTPFVHFLRRNIFWRELHRNVAQGAIDAVSICATHMMSGRTVLFIEKGTETAYQPGSAVPVFGPISSKHILGSAAIPVIFPLIRIDNEYYGDGSLRQNTPLNPALKLGAERVLIVSLFRSGDHKPPADEAMASGGMEPTLGDISGQLLDSLFLDKLDYDLRQLDRINRLISDFEAVYGEDALERVNRLRETAGGEATGNPPLHKVRQLTIRPSVNIGVVAAHMLRQAVKNEPVLSPVQRFFQKVIEGSPEEENDLVSYLLFTRDYLSELISLGYADAERAHDRLVAFFTDEAG